MFFASLLKNIKETRRTYDLLGTGSVRLFLFERECLKTKGCLDLGQAKCL